MAHQFTNSLIHQKSPYLLQHAHNPVNWVAWENTQLEKAAAKQQLLIISIGYAACHWCHVMEAECFENSTVAAFMNAHFIPIKVDREERPDIDHLYMEALQLFTGSGGWPLNIVALPDGRPLWGCTYLPADQWLTALQRIVELHQKDPKKLEAYGNKMLTYLSTEPPTDTALEGTPLNFEVLTAALLHNGDAQYGGYRAPKFMMPVILDSLLKMGTWEQHPKALKALHTTLSSIALGGIHDTISGGLSRYAVDAEWHIPHFEKMAYDNGLALSTYATAYRLEKNPLYKQVVDGILKFLSDWLLEDRGRFYSAVDADSKNTAGENEEGAYYHWELPLLEDLLKDDFPLFADYYNCNSKGHWENGKYVLFRTEDATAFATKNNIPLSRFLALEKKWNTLLEQHRRQRHPPSIDKKILCSWNAIVSKGLLEAYRTFNDPKTLEFATNNLEFLFNHLVEPNGGVHRYVYDNGQKTPGFLEDYAYLISACVHCYETVFDALWLERAKLLLEYCLTHFKANNSPLLFFTAQQHNSLLIRKIDCEDNVIPSANAIMAENLLHLGAHFNQPQWTQQAKAMVQAMQSKIQQSPKNYSKWMAVALECQQKQLELVVVGPQYKTYFKTIHRLALPAIRLAGSATAASLPLLKNRYKEGETRLYWCKNKSCDLPTTNLEAIVKKLSP